MDPRQCSTYIYVPFKELSDVLEARLCGNNIKIIDCKPEHRGFSEISDYGALEEIRRNAVVLFSLPNIINKVLQGENKLQWAQSFTAGVNLIKNGSTECPSGVQLTRMTEGWEDSMVEYVLGHIIARERNFNVLREVHEEKAWDRQKDDISEFLEDCDYLVSVLPGTSETKYMLSGDVLKSCIKKKPYFINIGRGNVIDTKTLEKAISEEWISGALLDVVDKEPVAPDDPLWNIPNVTITPHISGKNGNFQKMADVFARNLEKFIRKENLDYKFDWNSGY